MVEKLNSLIRMELSKFMDQKAQYMDMHKLKAKSYWLFKDYYEVGNRTVYNEEFYKITIERIDKDANIQSNQQI